MDTEINEWSLSAPGSEFADSFLLGNGFFGAALTMRPEREEVLLSHGCFWAGAPARKHGRPGAPEAFRKARALSMKGAHAAAWEALKDFIGEKENYGTNLPVGSLIITQKIPAWKHYRRTLSFIRGIASCEWTHDGFRQTWEAACGTDPRVLTMTFLDGTRMELTFRIEGACIQEKKTEDGTLLFFAQAREHIHSDGRCGVNLCGGVRVKADRVTACGDGTLTAEGREIRLWLTMETDYDPDPEKEKRDRHSLLREILKTLGRAEQADAFLKQESLSSGGASLPVPRIQIQGQDRINRQIRFGEYLLRRAVTEESPLPPNLQGIWNDGEACRLGWTNDDHLDVNTQMNLWYAESLGEGERLKPLFRFMKQRLIPEGRKTARGYYGLPGAVAELSTNAFGYAAPFWGRTLAPCPGCGFWLCETVIRHADSCPADPAFQREAAELLAPYTEFALAYLTETPEGLAGGPSVSPENGFRVENRTVYASMGTTFENAQLRILLAGYGRICRRLDRTAPADGLGKPVEETLREAERQLWHRSLQALARLPRPRVNAEGEIAEYGHDLPVSDPHHRHLSHLTGLYPGTDITPDDTELAAAAEKTMQSRLISGDAWESTPWARIMLALYSARLGLGDQALAHLEFCLDRHLSPSLLLMHPAIPGTDNPRPVWELDGNTGFPEAVKEMLVQFRADRLILLPALPEKWKEGGALREIQAGPWRVRELIWKRGQILSLIVAGRPGTSLRLERDGIIQTRVIPENGVCRETI